MYITWKDMIIFKERHVYRKKRHMSIRSKDMYINKKRPMSIRSKDICKSQRKAHVYHKKDFFAGDDEWMNRKTCRKPSDNMTQRPR